MIKETKRSPHDALCVCQGIWSTNNSVVYGGGSAEISCSIAHAADRHPGVEQVCVDFGASLWIRMHFVFHSISGTEYRCLGTLHSCEFHLQILFVFYRSMDLYWQAIYIFFYCMGIRTYALLIYLHQILIMMNWYPLLNGFCLTSEKVSYLPYVASCL